MPSSDGVRYLLEHLICWAEAGGLEMGLRLDIPKAQTTGNRRSGCINSYCDTYKAPPLSSAQDHVGTRGLKRSKACLLYPQASERRHKDRDWWTVAHSVGWVKEATSQRRCHPITVSKMEKEGGMDS